MNPRPQSAGITGILAGIALVGEFMLFGISGFPGAAFSDPAATLPYLRDGGALLRAAVLFGAAGVAFCTVFFAGLAARQADQRAGSLVGLVDRRGTAGAPSGGECQQQAESEQLRCHSDRCALYVVRL